MNRFTSSALLLSALLLGLAPEARAQLERFEGRPTFAEGIDLAYYVWKDGDSWHLRWTTLGQLRRFSGSVTAEGGELKSLKRVDLETERRVLYPGRRSRVVVGPRGRAHVRPGRAPVVVTREQDSIEKDGDDRIVFVTRTDDIDGFDFKVDEKVTALRFVLDIDGRQLPHLVELGKDNVKPERLPLLVRLK